MSRRWSRGAWVVGVAVVLLAGACGSNDEPEVAEPEPEVVADPTPPASEEPVSADPTPAAEAPADSPDLMGTAFAFLDALEAGDPESLVALLAPEYRDRSLGPLTVAQFWTFTSQFDLVANMPATCDEVASQVECVWRGVDDLSNVLGYQKQGAFLFTYDEGLIDDILYFANDTEILVGISRWVDDTHPGEPGCGADAEELEAYYGGAGVLVSAEGEVFGAACAARLVEHAAEYRDSGLYIPPQDG